MLRYGCSYILPDRLMVGHLPLEEVILVRVQVWQQKKIPPRAEFSLGEASKLLCSRLGIEDLELVILNFNFKSREGCTEPVRFDKRTRGPSLPASHFYLYFIKENQFDY